MLTLRVGLTEITETQYGESGPILHLVTLSLCQSESRRKSRLLYLYVYGHNPTRASNMAQCLQRGIEAGRELRQKETICIFFNRFKKESANLYHTSFTIDLRDSKMGNYLPITLPIYV